MGKTTIPVTKEILYVGMRVTRGKDWDPYYKNQDEGNGIGTIVTLPHKLTPVWCDVKWDNGRTFAYRIDGYYDLYVYNEEKEALKESAPKFTMGQDVYVTEYGDDIWMKKQGLKVGQKCKVTVLDNDGCIHVDNHYYAQKAEYFSATKPAIRDTPDFKIGDRVILNKFDESGWAQKQGLVIGGKYTVAERGGILSGKPAITVKDGSWWIPNECFSLTMDTETSETKVTFEVGDEVWYTYPGGIQYFSIGSFHTVTAVSLDGVTKIKVNNGPAWIDAKEFTLKSKKATTQKQEESKRGKFSKGDYIQVVRETYDIKQIGAKLGDHYVVKDCKWDFNAWYIWVGNYKGTTHECGYQALPYWIREDGFVKEAKQPDILSAKSVEEKPAGYDYTWKVYDNKVTYPKEKKEEDYITSVINKTQTKTKQHGKESSKRSSNIEQPQVRRKTRSVKRAEGRQRKSVECRRR